MGKLNGHGGYAVVDGAPPQRIDNSEYNVEYEVLIDDVTDSSSGGVAAGLACIGKVNSVELNIVEDSDFYVTALGLNEGTVVSLWLRRGATAVWDYVANTIVRSTRTSNPQDKARRLVLTCEYGRLTRNVSGPAGFP